MSNGIENYLTNALNATEVNVTVKGKFCFHITDKFFCFTTIHPDFSWSEKSGWIGMKHGKKWKYSVSLRFQ